MMEQINFSHRSVLLDECIEALAIRENGIYVDGTAGGAGHSSHIAARLGEQVGAQQYILRNIVPSCASSVSEGLSAAIPYGSIYLPLS